MPLMDVMSEYESSSLPGEGKERFVMRKQVMRGDNIVADEEVRA